MDTEHPNEHEDNVLNIIIKVEGRRKYAKHSLWG